MGVEREIRASRRSQVEDSGRTEKKIHTDATRHPDELQKGGARYAPYGGCRFPFNVAHGGANDNSSAWQRPSYRPSRCFTGIPVPFSHPPHSPALPLCSPFQNDSRLRTPSRLLFLLLLLFLLVPANEASEPNEWRS